MQAKVPRIGDILVRQGRVTPEQLEQALNAQVIFGGRVGTNLVDMDLLSIIDLGRCLSEQRGVPEATPEDFISATERLIDQFPRELAVKFKVFPLRVQQKMLHLAMMDPQDVQQISEITFNTGLRVKPYVAPELRMLFFLEQRFDIPREKRFLRVRVQGEPDDPRRRYLEATVHVSEAPPNLNETTMGDDAVLQFPRVAGTDEHPAVAGVRPTHPGQPAVATGRPSHLALQAVPPGRATPGAYAAAARPAYPTGPAYPSVSPHSHPEMYPVVSPSAGARPAQPVKQVKQEKDELDDELVYLDAVPRAPVIPVAPPLGPAPAPLTRKPDAAPAPVSPVPARAAQRPAAPAAPQAAAAGPHSAVTEDFEVTLDLSSDEDTSGRVPVPSRSPGYAADATVPASPPGRGAAAPATAPTGLAAVLAALARASNRDEVTSLAVRPVLASPTLSVLFLVRGEMAVALAASGSSMAGDDIRRLVLPLTPSSLLWQAMTNVELVRAAATADPLQQVISGYLRASPPTEACVSAIAVGTRVVNLLCVQKASGLFDEEELSSLRKLTEGVASGYARLIRQLKGQT